MDFVPVLHLSVQLGLDNAPPTPACLYFPKQCLKSISLMEIKPFHADISPGVGQERAPRLPDAYPSDLQQKNRFLAKKACK